MSLVELAWEGLSHRKGMVKQRRPREQQMSSHWSREGETTVTKHLPSMQTHARYWQTRKEAVLEGKELRLRGQEFLSCASAFAITSSVTSGRLLNVSGRLACQVRESDQVTQDVCFCPDSL